MHLRLLLLLRQLEPERGELLLDRADALLALLEPRALGLGELQLGLGATHQLLRLREVAGSAASRQLAFALGDRRRPFPQLRLQRRDLGLHLCIRGIPALSQLAGEPANVLELRLLVLGPAKPHPPIFARTKDTEPVDGSTRRSSSPPTAIAAAGAQAGSRSGPSSS